MSSSLGYTPKDKQWLFLSTDFVLLANLYFLTFLNRAFCYLLKQQKKLHPIPAPVLMSTKFTEVEFVFF